MSLNKRLINTNAGAGGGLFLAAGQGNYNAAYSTDGIIWTGVTDPSIAFLNYCYAAGSADGNYYLSGYSGDVYSIYHSTDAITWTERTNPQPIPPGPPGPPGNIVTNFFFDGVKLYCIGSRTYYTNDLTASGGWIQSINSSFTNYGEAMCYTGSNYVLTGRGTPVIKYSGDANVWTNSSPTAIAFNAIGVSANGTGTVVAAGYDVSRVAYSTNHGVSWTNTINSGSVGYLSYWDGTHFHVDIQGGSYYRSTSGTGGWMPFPKPLSNRVESMASNGSILVAGGAGTSTLTYSTDGGFTWSALGTTIFTTCYDLICDGDPNILKP